MQPQILTNLAFSDFGNSQQSYQLLFNLIFSVTFEETIAEYAYNLFNICTPCSGKYAYMLEKIFLSNILFFGFGKSLDTISVNSLLLEFTSHSIVFFECNVPSRFTDVVPRDKLKQPPATLSDLSLYMYAFSKIEKQNVAQKYFCKHICIFTTAWSMNFKTSKNLYADPAIVSSKVMRRTGQIT